MYSDNDVQIHPVSLDPAVWRLDVPLVVLERTDGPHLLSVWIAVRWLQAADPTRRGFSTREIARRAKVDRKYVTQWVSRLVALNLMEIVGEEPMPNLRPRPIYAIPLAFLEAVSLELAPQVVSAYRTTRTVTPLPPAHVPDSVTVRVVLPSLGGAGDQVEHVVLEAEPAEDEPPGDIEDRRGDIEDQAPGDIEDDPSGGIKDHIKEGNKERGRETAHAREGLTSRAEAPPTPTPPSNPPLPAAPLTLWHSVRLTTRPMDDIRIQALIADHDTSTDGYGAYWVGRAILAADATDASFATNPKALNLLRAILQRWRREQAYGSDTPAFVQRQQTSTDHSRKAVPSRATLTASGSPSTGRARWRTATASGPAAVPTTAAPEEQPASSSSSGNTAVTAQPPATASPWRRAAANAGGVA